MSGLGGLGKRRLGGAGGASGGAAVQGTYKNLKVVNGATADTQVTVTADELVLKDANGNPYLASAVNVTATITGSGANGLDTGAEAASTWYNIWLIYNGTTVAALLSTSATAPTMPSGYTYKALVGAVYNNASSNFDTMRQIGNRVWINLSSVFTGLGAAAVDTYESRSISAFVPPIAKAVDLLIGAYGGTNSNAAAGNSSGLGAIMQVDTAASGTARDGFTAGPATGMVPMPTAQTVYWKSYGSTGAYNSMSVKGYTL